MATVREADPSSVGMMEGAFFVSRRDLLIWLNTNFNISLDRVEDCASGVVYLQIMDAMYPGKVPRGKIKWTAKQEYEYIHNYKLLQEVFNKMKINKHIEVDKLIKGKYQDNLELLQWMKAYYERTVGEDPEYKAPAGPVKNLPQGASLTAKHSFKEQRDHFKQLAEHFENLLINEQDQRALLEQEKEFYFQKLRQIEIRCDANKGGTLPVPELTAILYAKEGEDVPDLVPQ